MRAWVIGHGRNGTQYVAHLFRKAHWDVGTEEIGKDGISSWQWAAPAARKAWWGDPPNHAPRPPVVLHTIRNPVDALPSIAWADEETEPWRRKWVFIPRVDDEIVRAMWSYLGWNLLCRAQATHTTQTERAHLKVAEITGVGVGEERGVNSRGHAEITEDGILRRIGTCPVTLAAWERCKSLWHTA